jgi:SAM-dependent methyltransferase
MTVNVDPAEIAKFSELAHRWWDPTSEFKPLHDINPLRLDYIDSIATIKNKAVLDVGCGGGILAESMAQTSRSRLPDCICSNQACRWITAGLRPRIWRASCRTRSTW